MPRRSGRVRTRHPLQLLRRRKVRPHRGHRHDQGPPSPDGPHRNRTLRSHPPQHLRRTTRLRSTHAARTPPQSRQKQKGPHPVDHHVGAGNVRRLAEGHRTRPRPSPQRQERPRRGLPDRRAAAERGPLVDAAVHGAHDAGVADCGQVGREANAAERYRRVVPAADRCVPQAVVLLDVFAEF
uniref:(northern house mosquito) hypothetical protein n=1 Tax=Culex pipiens TaxID=7175 RepID=A0A8D8GCG6_CULPI